ncbi:MAG: hypothetical protein R3C02_20640 [Planctomycetaceae bacterium]
MSVAPEEATADMATIARVMTHRFLRQGSQLQSSALAITCGFPTLIYGSVWLSSPETASEMAKSIGPMGFLFFLSELFVVPGLVCVAVVQIRPLHALPISTFKLVNLQLALGVTSACVIHLLTVAYYAAAFNNWLLVLSPMLSLGLMVLVMSGLVVLWLDFRWWRPLLVFGVCMLLPWLASDRVTTSDMEFTWSQRFSLNENEIVVLMSLAAIAYPITLRGARLDRCGELRSWPDIEVWLHRLGQAVIRRLGHRHKAASQVEFTSPASAQLWYEFWGKGWIVPAITLFSCTVSLLSAYESRSGWLSSFPGDGRIDRVCGHFHRFRCGLCSGQFRTPTTQYDNQSVSVHPPTG